MTQILKMFSGATAQQIATAQKVSDFLSANGFVPENFDDMVYLIASEVCSGIQDEQARSSEFAAAYEINSNTLAQQLTLVAAWTKDTERFRRYLEKEIKLNFAPVFE